MERIIYFITRNEKLDTFYLFSFNFLSPKTLFVVHRSALNLMRWPFHNKYQNWVLLYITPKSGVDRKYWPSLLECSNPSRVAGGGHRPVTGSTRHPSSVTHCQW